MRVKCKRFPPIEKDMKMVLAHCGSIFLDPAALTDVYHEMVVLERIHQSVEFSPGASLEAMTKPLLRRH
jgi:type III protein arginine methyltransferase